MNKVLLKASTSQSQKILSSHLNSFPVVKVGDALERDKELVELKNLNF